MRSAVAVVALASVAAASMAADYDGGYVNDDIVADGYVDEPFQEDGYGVDTYGQDGITDITEDYPAYPDECSAYDDKDEHKDCNKHNVSPGRPVIYETVVHTVISCSEEVVSIMVFDMSFL